MTVALRVRFAPSPTGALHIGGARTALYNWLLAHRRTEGGERGGTLLLRIEDTDRERSTPENVEQILDALRWLELDWDEGPIFQTDRAARHAEALEQLLDTGHAYRSSATAEDVRAYKATHGADRGFRGSPEAGGAIRLRVPDGRRHGGRRRDPRPHELSQRAPRRPGDRPGRRVASSTTSPSRSTISTPRSPHVVRGEDHLSNTPKQLLVFAALGAAPPRYAHLPLLHGPDGRKLSKRHGAASVQELREAGYLPEAVTNYIALLGAGFAADEEHFSRTSWPSASAWSGCRRTRRCSTSGSSAT